MSRTNPWLIYAKDDLDALDALEHAPIPRVTCFHETRYPPDLGLLPGGEPTGADAARAARIARVLYHHFYS